MTKKSLMRFLNVECKHFVIGVSASFRTSLKLSSDADTSLL